MDKQVKKLVLDAAEHLKSLGAQVDEVSLLDPKYSISVYTILQRAEVSSNLARFDGVRYAQDRQFFSEKPNDVSCSAPTPSLPAIVTLTTKKL